MASPAILLPISDVTRLVEPNLAGQPELLGHVGLTAAPRLWPELQQDSAVDVSAFGKYGSEDYTCHTSTSTIVPDKHLSRVPSDSTYGSAPSSNADGRRTYRLGIERSESGYEPNVKRPRRQPRLPHTTVERRYRENLNAHLDKLRQAIPLLAAPRKQKPSKCEILHSAIEYIEVLRQATASRDGNTDSDASSPPRGCHCTQAKQDLDHADEGNPQGVRLNSAGSANRVAGEGLQWPTQPVTGVLDNQADAEDPVHPDGEFLWQLLDQLRALTEDDENAYDLNSANAEDGDSEGELFSSDNSRSSCPSASLLAHGEARIVEIVSCAGSGSSSRAVSSKSVPESSQEPSTSPRSVNNDIQRPRRKRDDDEEDDDNGRSNKRRAEELSLPETEGNKHCERIQCVLDDCPGLTPSISEWLRKLETCHGIFICSRCWQIQGQAKASREHCCREQLCVCTKPRSAPSASEAHERVLNQCEENKKRVKEAQYSYICRLLNVPPKGFVLSTKVWHTNEKSRRTDRRHDIEHEIEQEVGRIRGQQRDANARNRELEGNLKGCHLIILQLAERLCDKGADIPQSVCLGIRQHALGILEDITALQPPTRRDDGPPTRNSGREQAPPGEHMRSTEGMDVTALQSWTELVPTNQHLFDPPSMPGFDFGCFMNN